MERAGAQLETGQNRAAFERALRGDRVDGGGRSRIDDERGRAGRTNHVAGDRVENAVHASLGRRVQLDLQRKSQDVVEHQRGGPRPGPTLPDDVHAFRIAAGDEAADSDLWSDVEIAL